MLTAEELMNTELHKSVIKNDTVEVSFYLTTTGEKLTGKLLKGIWLGGYVFIWYAEHLGDVYSLYSKGEVLWSAGPIDTINIKEYNELLDTGAASDDITHIYTNPGNKIVALGNA